METKRSISRELEKILYKKINVLDKGFVIPLDYMGNDMVVANSARISYSNKKSKSTDEKLIRYLMRSGHTSPFEQCEIQFHIKIPMDSWRQMVRHRTASINEISTRYSVVNNETQETKTNEWRLQSKNNKQGSDGMLPKENGVYLSRNEEQIHNKIKEFYNTAIKSGVAREVARRNLTLSTYTEAIWKIDLHNLLHFLELRLDKHAQTEIRSYAIAIASIVKQWVPITYKAFEDYKLNSIRLNLDDIKLIKLLGTEEYHKALIEANFMTQNGKYTREGKEYLSKLNAVGFGGQAV